MIGRFIENENMRTIPDTDGKGDSTFLSPTQFVHRLDLHVAGDSEHAQMSSIG